MASTSDSTRKRTLESNVEDGSVPIPKRYSESLAREPGEGLRSIGRGSRIADGEDRTEN